MLYSLQRYIPSELLNIFFEIEFFIIKRFKHLQTNPSLPKIKNAYNIDFCTIDIYPIIYTIVSLHLVGLVNSTVFILDFTTSSYISPYRNANLFVIFFTTIQYSWFINLLNSE